MDPREVFPNWPCILERGELNEISPEGLDHLLSLGWRHFGESFFRNSYHLEKDCWSRVTPLRINLSEFSPSKSQRRKRRKNQDLKETVAPANPGQEEEELFEKHKVRFRENIPGALSDFLGDRPNEVPGPCLQLSLRQDGKLVAASFFDVGRSSVSSIYGFFDPEYAARGLGILTMLNEIEWALMQQKQYYYSGYGTIEPSAYDYKKSFRGLESYDWESWSSI